MDQRSDVPVEATRLLHCAIMRNILNFAIGSTKQIEDASSLSNFSHYPELIDTTKN